MKNAKELLDESTAASFRDPKQAAEMPTEDGAFEMPISRKWVIGDPRG